jgi:hypothetical protein
MACILFAWIGFACAPTRSTTSVRGVVAVDVFDASVTAVRVLVIAPTALVIVSVSALG